MTRRCTTTSGSHAISSLSIEDICRATALLKKESRDHATHLFYNAEDHEFIMALMESQLTYMQPVPCVHRGAIDMIAGIGLIKSCIIPKGEAWLMQYRDRIDSPRLLKVLILYGTEEVDS